MTQTISCLLMSMTLAALADASTFRSARPVWPAGREAEMNLFVGFRVIVDAPAGEKVAIRIAASTLYRLRVNGEFVGHGPARGPHGWYRVDAWDLTDRLRAGSNVVTLEVAGYNSNSYYLLDQPSFVQAEITSGDKVIASTAGEGTPFEATLLSERLQKVQRYSFQRPFMEVYQLSPDDDAWMRRPDALREPAACAALPARTLLPRRVPCPKFNQRPACWHVAKGKLKTGVEVKKLWKDRSLANVGPKLKGYPESELTCVPSTELQHVANATRDAIDKPLNPTDTLTLGQLDYHILDFGTNLTGFLGARIECRQKTRLVLTFDEILSDGDVNFRRLGCMNGVVYELAPGSYALESFEPYTMRYVKCQVLAGEATVSGVYLREYVNPDTDGARFAAADDRLNRLFEAARQTFAQNAVDIFMDCPSRERAGWLCDSFFTSRTARDLSGNTLVERNFLENFLLPPSFAHLPEGMLPMCYPADHYDEVFIPNWAMWFVVELEEYLARSGDQAMVDALEPKIMKLLDYFEPFTNEDGLLEKLNGWVFVEWSKAAEFVQDVNYPTNMLYAATLATAGRLYDKPELLAQAERIRETIRKQSYDGQFFVDNATRQDGKLEVTRNRTEVCQYYAFFFEVATPETFPDLWKILRDEFGPKRQESKAYPEIHVANSFIGNVLRLELLSREALSQQLLDESVAYHLYMADRTGTLWENTGAYASCNHGFASHLAHVLFRDVLGLYRVDPIGRMVTLRFCDLDLPWCRGTIPTEIGPIDLEWRQENGQLSYKVDVPTGYAIEVENRTGRPLVRRP